MPLHRLTRHKGLPFSLLELGCRASVRMASTIVGKSGRVYAQGEMLRRRRNERNTFKAESGNESFLLKHVPTAYFTLCSQYHPLELSGTRRLRMHVDYNDEKRVLVYPYFRGTLLELMGENPTLSDANRRTILRHVAEAIHELHSRDWIHLDVKPQNIFVNWTCNDDGTKTITDVALGDFWVAWQLAAQNPRQTLSPVGSIKWRSPEAHAGKAMTKASDMYSFGLVCMYVLGLGHELGEEYDEQAIESDFELELEAIKMTVAQRFAYFGPVTEGFLEQINDPNFSRSFKASSDLADYLVRMTPGPPGLQFKSWGAARGLGPEALDMILGATKTDPAARLTIDQVLAHPLWQAKRPAVTPTRLFYPSSLADDATVKVANEDILRFAAQNITNPQYQAFLRWCGFDWPLMWLQINFPPASRPQSDNNGFVYCQLGTFPRDISYADKTEKEGEGADGKTSTVVTIPQDDTRLVLVGKRQGDGSAPAARIDGIKQGGVVCVALCVLPPAGVGAPGALAGTSLADKTGGTPAMKAAEQALLGFLRELQDDGYQGSDPQGEVVDGCQAIVFMGQELLVSEYSKQRGFFDPAGGYVFEKKKVSLGWPFLEESEQK